MAAGATDPLWEGADIVNVLEAWEALESWMPLNHMEVVVDQGLRLAAKIGQGRICRRP